MLMLWDIPEINAISLRVFRVISNFKITLSNLLNLEDALYDSNGKL